ncbi:thiosulfate/3-mercaptopyruvate sulfurtransferase [Halomicrobium zhouii]|uniref:Thiosulfate/3-mercaptopyruvate sulfurtransferase n=1 Tax=Halomicrobium zhouii TaxID=767519 RepID=A0A1I6KBM8_9EURY|nr:rhodanese-like domain-containing protein [Halomicrobium zhouii]SFR88596.1 thiosulfate/3-mercaptopyruvate sulfurtransferase [Halomicrobium zhouii]
MTDIVSTDWVADHLGDLGVVDVRDAWEYDGIGHLPGAVNIPFDSFRAEEHAAEGSGGANDDSSTGMLPDAEDFEALLGENGIATDDEIVAYDDMHGVFAARFLVTAELLGHDPEKLHLLDGDFSAWQREHETTSDAPGVEATDYVVDPPAESVLVDADAVAAAGDDPETVVVDTREDWEYEEGHVPGAILLDWKDLVDDESRGILPRDEALAVLEERGITPNRRVVLYCNTARRISHTYVVLRHLGFEDLAFYEGSLTEWEEQDRPLETGS